MGIPPDRFGSLEITFDAGRLTSDEWERIHSGEGIDVTFSEIEKLPDETLAYKGQRVFVYIRDVHAMGGNSTEPKYHFMTCRTIATKNKNGSGHRYVVNAQKDGNFQLNFIANGYTRRETRRLKVCQNCLDESAFDGFHGAMSIMDKVRIVESFTPEKFFEIYSQTLHRSVPAYGWENSPLDDYTSDFPEISRRTREAAGWKCKTCSLILSEPKNRRFLHVHHIEGLRSDNAPSNLKVVCIRCHAEEPNHAHMKSLPEYRQFVRVHLRDGGLQ